MVGDFFSPRRRSSADLPLVEALSRHLTRGFSVKYWRYRRRVREYSSTSGGIWTVCCTACRGRLGEEGLSADCLTPEVPPFFDCADGDCFLEDSIQATMDLTELPLRPPGAASNSRWARGGEICGRPRLEEKLLKIPLCSLLRLMMLSLESRIMVDGLEGRSTAVSGTMVGCREGGLLMLSRWKGHFEWKVSLQAELILRKNSA